MAASLSFKDQKSQPDLLPRSEHHHIERNFPSDLQAQVFHTGLFTPATPPCCWHAQIHIQALTQREGGTKLRRALLSHYMLRRCSTGCCRGQHCPGICLLPLLDVWTLPPCVQCQEGSQPWGHIQLTVIVCLQDKPILCEAGSSLCRQCYLTLTRTIHSPRTKESLV